jgi:hypothetical protein
LLHRLSHGKTSILTSPEVFECRVVSKDVESIDQSIEPRENPSPFAVRACTYVCYFVDRI